MKVKLFYVHPIGDHTNERICELLSQTDTPDLCHKKVCGTKDPICVIRLRASEMLQVWTSRLTANLKFDVYRDTIDGLVHIRDVEKSLGLEPQKKEHRRLIHDTKQQIGKLVARRNRGVMPKNCLPA